MWSLSSTSVLSLLLSPAIADVFVERHPHDGKKTCTVKSNGNEQDDVPHILDAFSECGHGGKVIFLGEQNYWIAQRLNPIVNDIEIDWRGTWTFSDNLTYWRENSYMVPFQNHRAAFILTGNNISINGHQPSPYWSTTPNINGNGDVWYRDEAGKTREGRPMPFVFWNVTNVHVQNFHIKDPQLWSFNIMNGTNMLLENIKSNATAIAAPYGENWVQNTDGFDTMDAHNITLRNMWYQGGDDCIAIKPRSYNIDVQNITCHGGNGIAIGSLGQYLEDSSVSNIVIDNVDIIRYNEDMHNCAYIKTWVGVPTPQSSYESAGQPRGGGWGNVSHVTFSNFRIQGADGNPAITQDNGNNGSFSGTSKMLVSDVRWVNFTGWLNKKSTVVGSVGCSKVNPCYGISFEDIHLRNEVNGSEHLDGSCKYIKPRGVYGLVGGGCE